MTADRHALRFFQLYGKEIRLIKYWDGTGTFEYVHKNIFGDLPTEVDTVFLPFDGDVVALETGMSRADFLENLGLNVEVLEKLSFSNGIMNVSRNFWRLWADSIECEEGIKALSNYRKKLNNTTQEYSSVLHNRASHGADAMRYLMQAVLTLEQDDEAQGDVVSAQRL